ncbi:hypothetical protein GDO86_002014 [Hymenochirus boettgeri]|uniref:M-phase phosphoprotein 9 n=2 Tax=Hymenochirus boettgeri TaxID=247094 RepID=A0A8T2KL22_9PIPI|nr:hypothetical protein GDO86_002014 [Hymenochirus boettgeri]
MEYLGNKQNLKMDILNSNQLANEFCELPLEQNSERRESCNEADITSSDDLHATFTRELCKSEPADGESRKSCEVTTENNKQSLNMDILNSSQSANKKIYFSLEQNNEVISGDRSATSNEDQHASFSRDLCINEPADLEARKSCEARWFELFQLVEKQCQDQIAGQQEQFNHQLQVIRDEMKNFIHLQSHKPHLNISEGNIDMDASSDVGTQDIHDGRPLGVQKIQEFSSNSSPTNNECNLQYKEFKSQEQCLDNTSVSSGYGTHSVSEPYTCFTSFSNNTLRDSREIAERCSNERRETGAHHLLLQEAKENENPFLHDSSERCELQQRMSKDECFTAKYNSADCTDRRKPRERTNSKSLTTWAQRLKQRHNRTDQDSVHSHHTSTQSYREALTQSENTDCSSSAFYLNNRTTSANSLVSTASGFTYWTLDENEMYCPLPQNLEIGFSKCFSTKSQERSIPSLTKVYQQKQKESLHLNDWKPLSPSEYTHPPEVLTLDPNLHRKASKDSENSKIPLSPDSIFETASFNHYNHSVSSESSLLGHNSQEDTNEEWKSKPYQHRVNLDYHPCPGDEIATFTDDEVNSVVFSSVSPSPLPAAEENKSDSTGIPSLDHPLMLSNIRQSLKEKHARHLADLRDYYESEISNLKQQLLTCNKSSSSDDLNKINSLSEKCGQLEEALTEASTQIHILENQNHKLEMQVAELKEQCQTANTTTTSLKDHLKELQAKEKEKDNSISQLRFKLKEVSDDKNAQIKEYHKMYQNILTEYNSLLKEHNQVKDTLQLTKNKLDDAQDEGKELKRSLVKIEAQIKQVEHENMIRLRQMAKGQISRSSANSEIGNIVKNIQKMDVSKRKCLTPGEDFSIQSLDNSGREMNKSETEYVPKRYSSSPEKDVSCDENYQANTKQKDCETQESPILKALRDFEEEKHIRSLGIQTEKENCITMMSNRTQIADFSGCWTPCRSPEKREYQRRLNSPSGPRSSSVPPSNKKSVSTPKKRELMLTPVTVKYSPKRLPAENLSPGFSQILKSEENSMTRFYIAWEDLATPKHPNSRKKLEFISPDSTAAIPKTNTEASKKSNQPQFLALSPPYETEFTYKERMKTIADTERLFDELIQEKQQIEAALSRLPSFGCRLTLEMKTNKEKLEDRLEKINRELGSLRITLKRFQILPTSANY